MSDKANNIYYTKRWKGVELKIQSRYTRIKFVPLEIELADHYWDFSELLLRLIGKDRKRSSFIDYLRLLYYSRISECVRFRLVEMTGFLIPIAHR